MKQIHYLNGKYVTEEKLLISPRDLGFARGFAVFDYLRTYNNKLFKLNEHLERLLKSAKLINLRHDYNLNQLVRIVQTTFEKNKHIKGEKTARIFLSGGISKSLHQSSKATLVVVVDPFKPRKREIYKNGIKAGLVNFVRYIPKAKTTNYLEAIRKIQDDAQNDKYELFYYTNKQVYEGLTSSVFVVKDGKIYTPKNNVLLGTTRGVLLRDLRRELHVIEKDFNLNFLLNADEIFIASSGKGIVPVVEVEGNSIGDSCVGKITRMVMKTFKSFTMNHDLN